MRNMQDPDPHPDSNLDPDPLVRGMDQRNQIRIRIHTKIPWILNTDSSFYQIKNSAKQTYNWLLYSFAIKGGNFC